MPNSYEKAPMLFYYQDSCTLADCLELCKFATDTLGQRINIEDMRQLLAAATGLELDEKEIRWTADRIYAMERAFLVREGIGRKDDALQGKWGHEPIRNSPSRGNGSTRSGLIGCRRRITNCRAGIERRAGPPGSDWSNWA